MSKGTFQKTALGETLSSAVFLFETCERRAFASSLRHLWELCEGNAIFMRCGRWLCASACRRFRLNTGRERTVSPSLLPHLFDIAAFTTFLSCFAKLTVKSSKAAKRFNAVRKAEVSWKRIRPMMKRPETLEELRIPQSADVTIKALSFSYEDACDCNADYNSDCNTNYNKEAIFFGAVRFGAPGRHRRRDRSRRLRQVHVRQGVPLPEALRRLDPLRRQGYGIAKETCRPYAFSRQNPPFFEEIMRDKH